MKTARLFAGAVGAGFLLLAAIGPGWEDNLVALAKDRVICSMLGICFLAFAGLGSGFGGFYKAAAIVLLNTFFLAASLELAASIDDQIENLSADDEAPQVTNPAIEGRPIQQKHTREYYSATEASRYEPFILWRRSPYSGETLKIDDAGLRHTPGSRCITGAYTVFAFGGSAMFGAGAPDAETIPAFLGKHLEALIARPVCIINFGQPGYVISQNVAQLVNLLLGGQRPDLVVFYDGFNDVYVAYAEGRADRHFYYDEASRVFEAQPAQWYENLSLYWALRPTVPGEWNWQDYTTRGTSADDLSRGVSQRYLNAYAAVEGLAHKWAFDFAIFIQPLIAVGNKRLTNGETTVMDDISEPLSTLTAMVYEQLEAGIPERPRLFSLRDVFDTVNGEIWRDLVHVPGEGNRIIANRMTTLLKANVIEPRLSPRTVDR